jgi:hypothetical protein
MFPKYLFFGGIKNNDYNNFFSKKYIFIFFIGAIGLRLNFEKDFCFHKNDAGIIVQRKNTSSHLLPPQESRHAFGNPNNNNFAIHVMGGSGLCSQLVNLLPVQFLYENVYHRNLLVDESFYEGYRRNSSEGVLTGFFTPQMPVLDEIKQRPDFVGKWFPHLVNASHFIFKHVTKDKFDKKNFINTSQPNSIEDAKGNETSFVTSSVFSHDNHFRLDWIRLLGSDWYSIYHKLIPYACENFQFNKRTQNEINSYLREQNITISSKNQNMVGFHVRRSDKIRYRESAFYKAEVYLSKWIQSLAEKDNTKAQDFTHCFVASDEYGAVKEFRAALDSLGIPCQLLTLTPSTQQGTSPIMQSKLSYNDTLHFLAEMSILINADYFIGTMGSNVGTFVTLMRSCPAYFRGEKINNATKELTKLKFYNSIGIDTMWYIREK